MPGAPRAPLFHYYAGILGASLAATLSILKMKYTNDTPSADVISNPQSLWMQSADHRKAVLDEICQQVVDTFVDFSFGQTNCNNDPDKVEEYGKQLLGIGCSGGFRMCERVVPTSGAQSAPEKFWVTTPIFAVKTRPFPVF